MRKLILLILYVTLPLGVAVMTYVTLQRLILSPANKSDSANVMFEVADQTNLKQVAKELEEKGLIKHSWAFTLIAQLKRKDTAIMAGEYELSPSLSPEEILDKMVTGKMLLRRITIKEGASIWDVGPLVEQAGILGRAEFEAALTDPQLLKEMNIAANSFEGYLFPETYQFPRRTKAKKILSTMVDQLGAIWKPEWNQRAQQLGLTKHQVLTLASIVEKETGNVDEQPLIASVFTNRLSRGMKLQADPTVIYGIPNFNGNLTKEDLQAPTPYNTYVIDGLPPGPIANPGAKAIEATLYPADTNNLYFVANGQGRHIFSENLTDHNQAVSEYQKNINKSEPKTDPKPEVKATKAKK